MDLERIAHDLEDAYAQLITMRQLHDSEATAILRGWTLGCQTMLAHAGFAVEIDPDAPLCDSPKRPIRIIPL